MRRWLWSLAEFLSVVLHPLSRIDPQAGAAVGLAVTLLTGIALLVLAVAAANVANLLMVRDAARRRNQLPMGFGGLRRTVFVEGRDVGERENGILVGAMTVADDYLDTMGIPLVRGRKFRSEEPSLTPRAAIINETMAARFWPDECLRASVLNPTPFKTPYLQFMPECRRHVAEPK